MGSNEIRPIREVPVSLRGHCLIRDVLWLLLTDAVHSQPVQQMGNYQQYLKLQPTPLREVDASPARLHTFGNPFKVNKVTCARSSVNHYSTTVFLPFFFQVRVARALSWCL